MRNLDRGVRGREHRAQRALDLTRGLDIAFARARPALPDPRPVLTVDQRHVVFLIGRGESPEDAAASWGVHPERLRRWLATPRFQRALYLERLSPMNRRQLEGMWDEEEAHHAE